MQQLKIFMKERMLEVLRKETNNKGHVCSKQARVLQERLIVTYLADHSASVGEEQPEAP